jgi:acyl-CoA synthetase (AMP-forming)/AMP-acid ligase II
MADFVATFSPCGFCWESFAPSYGLAENTLLATTKPKGTPPVFLMVETEAMERHQVVIAESKLPNGVRTLPSCGRQVWHTEIAIVNPDSMIRCADNEVGEIWIRDLSVAQGYWQNPQATETTFQAEIQNSNGETYLRTGDLGFLHNGELYITGRIKDLIIIRGTNHYPQDIEWSVQKLHSALRSDYGAAFSIQDKGEERLVVVQEVERHAGDLDTDKLIADIRQEIAEEHEIQLYGVVLAKSGNILKTASGKIQRRACKEKFLAGTLSAIADWCENPQYTSSYRHLQQEVDSLAQKVGMR